MLFLWVKVVLTLIFISKTASTGLGQEQSILMQPTYYDCGSWIVYGSSIRKLLYEDGIKISRVAEPFIELLYNLEPGYWKITIPKERMTPKFINVSMLKSNFYVIIGQELQIIDVVARMRNGHFIKCSRVDGSIPEPTSIGQNEYGYECGHELFSNEIVQMSAALALSNKIKSKLYQNKYLGPLYRPELNYFIYPISREKNQHHAGKVPENIYFVVISPTGELIDVIAQLMHTDFIKCVKTTKVPPDVESDKDVSHGYLCGLEFFQISHMKRTAELAKAKISHQRKQIYPKKYKDDSFEGYMYPLFPKGRFFGSVSGVLKYFIIMNLDFSVKSAAVRTPTGLKPCEESLREIEVTAPEKDNFICGYSNIEFENEKLLKLADVACKAIGSRDRKYPANYNGPAFNVHGPYVTWPIRYGTNQLGPSTRFRVVINNECMLAGVLEQHDEIFYKCRRSRDYSIPGGESEMPITENFPLRRKYGTQSSRFGAKDRG